MQRQCRSDAAEAARIPAYDRWFQSLTPYGTALDVDHRVFNSANMNRRDPRILDALHALAPRQVNLLESYIARKYGAKATDEQLASAYGPLADYDVRALRYWAGRVGDRPDAYQRVSAKMCDLDADLCLGVADYFWDHEMDDAAAAAFERAREHGRDKVALANAGDAPLDYYFDRGQLQKAKALAEEGAEVGSGSGFRIMGRFLERTGDYAGAESYYRRIAERYENTTPLEDFYLRRQVKGGDPRYRALAADAMKKQFPEGLQRVGIGDFNTPPAQPPQGLTISKDLLTEKLRRFGLQLGDQLYALDGYRVKNNDQFVVVRSFSDEPEMTAIVWRNGQYLEIKGRFARRRFGPRAKS
jgi:hypothetical protein